MRTTILVTCRDAATARDFTLPGARVKCDRGKRVLVSVPESRLDATIGALDDSDEVTGFEYEEEEG